MTVIVKPNVGPKGKAQQKVVSRPPCQDQQDIILDQRYFVSWKNDLKGSLQTNLPQFTAAEQTGFSTACKAVQAANKARKDAESLRDAISKEKPVDQEKLNQANQAVQDAEVAFQQTMDTCLAVAKPILEKDEWSDFTSTAFDDRDLITVTLFQMANPPRWVEWCKKGVNEKKLIVDFLNDLTLQRTFLSSGGPTNGNFLNALEIYTKIPKSKDPLLQRLALAVALELADPVTLFGHANKFVDPLQRYVHYEQAYLFGELDPAFSQFTVWELRMAINSDAPDDQLGWGRQSLMNYRPDLVLMDDPQWRYCRIVRTDVCYKVPDWYKEPHSYDQILAGGGKCGPRAWYGRFACKAFGVPTWGVRQPGHAAMTRWTTNGWVTCLGAGFQWSNWQDRCGLDFLLETQARNAAGNDELYLQNVLRIEWLARMLDEKGRMIRTSGLPDPDSLYLTLAMMQRKSMATNNEKKPFLLQHPRCSGPTQLEKLKQAPSVCEATIRDDRSGMIIIPAASPSSPAKPNNKVLFMKSFLGGQQLYLGCDATVEYTLTTSYIKLGENSKFQLSCRVCTAHRNEKPLLLTVSGDGKVVTDDPLQIAIPYTMGMWQETEPITIEIPDGQMIKLSVKRQDPNLGIAMKDIKLIPV